VISRPADHGIIAATSDHERNYLVNRKSSETNRMSTHSDSGAPEKESQFHTYSSHIIPWYVRLIWVIFWIFAITYVVQNFLPAIQRELLTPS
jgi:hypothetical protein